MAVQHTQNKLDLDRKGLVKVAIPVLADLFGSPGSVKVDGAMVMGDGTVLLLVSGHGSLPIVGPDEDPPQVYPVITDLEPMKRSVTFRSLPPGSN